MKNTEIIEKYKEKKLGAASYGENAPYFAKELANIDEAYSVLYEIWTHEGYLTSDGLEFLRELYSLENLAELLAEKGGFDEVKDKMSILKWLNSLKAQTID